MTISTVVTLKLFTFSNIHMYIEIKKIEYNLVKLNKAEQKIMFQKVVILS